MTGLQSRFCLLSHFASYIFACCPHRSRAALDLQLRLHVDMTSHLSSGIHLRKWARKRTRARARTVAEFKTAHLVPWQIKRKVLKGVWNRLYRSEALQRCHSATYSAILPLSVNQCAIFRSIYKWFQVLYTQSGSGICICQRISGVFCHISSLCIQFIMQDLCCHVLLSIYSTIQKAVTCQFAYFRHSA